MALTGNPDTGTSGTHVTLGRQALDYAQDGATEDQEAPGETALEPAPGASAAAPPAARRR